MDRLHKSMTAYMKTLSKRSEGDDKEKTLPVAYLGSTMLHHGEDFENDSEFGQCLMSIAVYRNCKWSPVNFEKVWEGQTSGSGGYKRPTLLMRLQAGLSRSSDP